MHLSQEESPTHEPTQRDAAYDPLRASEVLDHPGDNETTDAEDWEDAQSRLHSHRSSFQ